MKKLIGLLLMVGAFAATAAPTQPDPNKFYRIRHVGSGEYITNSGFSSKLAAKVEDNSQIVKFEPVSDGVYNIYRLDKKTYLGTYDKGDYYNYSKNNHWRNVAISRDNRYTHIRLEESGEAFKLKFIGKQDQSKAYLGTDDYTSDKGIYTDKDGNTADRHTWTLEEAEPYEEVVPEDVYPDYNLPDNDPRKNAYPGYKLVFAEEFSGEGPIDHDIWNFETGFKRNYENQYYNGDKNVFMRDGVCVVEGKEVSADKIPNRSYDPFGSTGWPGNIGKYLTWTSGSVQSKGGWNSGYTWMFGIYEVRARVPAYTGSWPAIWSTGKQYGWPKCLEIDLMEYYGGGIHGNVCWGNQTWNSCFISTNNLGSNWGGNYHIWRMYWDYDHIEMWCDETLVNNIDCDQIQNPGDYDPEANNGNGINPARTVRQYMWFNLALGGNAGGSLANTPHALKYCVDYCRVYQKIGTDGLATYHVDEDVSVPTYAINDNVRDAWWSGVEDVRVDYSPAEGAHGVYNLQGVCVADEPSQVAGTGKLYIVVENGESRKMIL